MNRVRSKVWRRNKPRGSGGRGAAIAGLFFISTAAGFTVRSSPRRPLLNSKNTLFLACCLHHPSACWNWQGIDSVLEELFIWFLFCGPSPDSFKRISFGRRRQKIRVEVWLNLRTALILTALLDNFPHYKLVLRKGNKDYSVEDPPFLGSSHIPSYIMVICFFSYFVSLISKVIQNTVFLKEKKKLTCLYFLCSSLGFKNQFEILLGFFFSFLPASLF